MYPREGYEGEALLHKVVSGSSSGHDDDSYVYELDEFGDGDDGTAHCGVPQTSCWWRPLKRRATHRRVGSSSSFCTFQAPRRRRNLASRIVQLLALFSYIILLCIVICGIFFPSYSRPPERYLELRNRVSKQGETANVNNEKVFIAASLYDAGGRLLSGQWGQSVLQLIEILGRENVFLSIYENDPGEMAQVAMDHFAANVPCQSALVTEHVNLSELPHVSSSNGVQRLKRIAFLADVRNRALRPLEDSSSPASGTRFDKLLYLNDVIFDPIDAANLLFSTNIDEQSGRTQYRAACAMDFINPFKFYDTFATRDLEGYESGVIFYPWFTHAGKSVSRKDVIQQKDAVRVKSCWGGMVAFEAKWFQQPFDASSQLDSISSASSGVIENKQMGKAGNSSQGSSDSTSLYFRADADTYWDSSECCLIHADLATMDPSSLPANETGIYMNPYIRVAYSPVVLPWLSFTKRFERLYTPINTIVNWIGGKPKRNERQFEEPGEEVIDKVWVWDEESQATLRNGSVDDLHGHFEDVHRTALPGGFCGTRMLLYINEDPLDGEEKWSKEDVPEGL